MKRLTLAILVLSSTVPSAAAAQVHLRAGAGGELGALIATGQWGPRDIGVMAGLTGKLGLGFPLGVGWRGAVYWDTALQAYTWGDPGPSVPSGGWLWWNHADFEVHKNRGSIAAGLGGAWGCGGTCTNAPAPGFAIVARATYELLKGMHNALSIGFEARLLFQNRLTRPGDAFVIVPALVLGWEHE